MPEPVHLYMLVAGIVLGVILSPAVLGNAAPGVYDTLFVGSGDTAEVEKADAAIDAFENDDDARKERIDQIMRQAEFVAEPGDTVMIGLEAQVAALNNAFADEREQLEFDRALAMQPVLDRRAEYADKLGGLATLLLLLVAVVMLIEPILAPQKNELDKTGQAEVPLALARLITARYGLLAGWLVLALAKPDWLLSINPVVAILLAAIVGLAAFIPLGKKTTA